MCAWTKVVVSLFEFEARAFYGVFKFCIAVHFAVAIGDTGKVE
jgi:hypothetical protein